MCNFWRLASCEIQSRVPNSLHNLEHFFTLSHTLPLHDSHLNTGLLIARIQANLVRNKANKMVDKIQPYSSNSSFRNSSSMGWQSWGGKLSMWNSSYYNELTRDVSFLNSLETLLTNGIVSKIVLFSKKSIWFYTLKFGSITKTPPSVSLRC